MKLSTKFCKRLLPATLLAVSASLWAQEPAPPEDMADRADVSSQRISPEARAVVDRMTAYLQGLESFSISTDVTRDEVVALGYKLQNNEHSEITVQRPDKLRAEVTGDIRERTFVYDGDTLTMFAPEYAAFVRTDAPDSLGELIGTLLALGVEMPLIDVLHQGTVGTLTQLVRGGILVGQTRVNGVDCDHLAFRQADVDWQLWVERGARPLPRKILITTRYEFGDPQYQAVLTWNLQPSIDSSTFAFAPPEGAVEIPLAQTLGVD